MTFFNRRNFLAGAMFLGAGLLAGCHRASVSPSAASVIKIGSLNSMTGDESTFGKSCNSGIRLAAEQQNARGGLLGKKIRIITADSESSPSKAQLAVLSLIDNHHVVAVLGDVASSNTKAAVPRCQKARIPLITPASTNPNILRGDDYCFRTCFTDTTQGKWIARFARHDLHATRAALLVDTKQAYSTGLARVIRAEFTRLGGKILLAPSYQSGDTNFQTQLTQIKAAHPQVVFLPGYYGDVTTILQQARELKITVPFVGGDGWDSQKTLQIGGKAVDGCYFTNHYDPSDPAPRVQKFVKAYEARYHGNVPDAMAVLGYDAANLLFNAIKRAHGTGEPALRNAIATTKNFPGVTGNITINKHRNAIKPGVVIKIEHDKFVVVKHEKP